MIYDEQAEQHAAAMACICQANAASILARLNLDAFHDRRCAAVVAAAAQVPDHDLPGDSPDPIERRIDAVAHAANQYPALLADWVAHCPFMWDHEGRIVRRIEDAAYRRRRAEELVDELRSLGVDIRWRNQAA